MLLNWRTVTDNGTLARDLIQNAKMSRESSLCLNTFLKSPHISCRKRSLYCPHALRLLPTHTHTHTHTHHHFQTSARTHTYSTPAHTDTPSLHLYHLLRYPGKHTSERK